MTRSGQYWFTRSAIGASLTALVLAAACPLDAEAQHHLLFGPGAEFVTIGVSRLNTSQLNDRLAAQQYPTFGPTALSVSLGGYRVLRGAWTLGAEWNGLIHPNAEHQGLTVGLGGGYGTVGVGRVVHPSPGSRVHARLGVGGGGMGLWVQEDAPPVGFDDVLANPDRFRLQDTRRHTVMSHTSVLADISVGVELLARQQGRGPMIGVRAGYVAAPASSEWNVGHIPVRNGPRASIAGPYLRVTLGTARLR
jgi:hypothetical protein